MIPDHVTLWGLRLAIVQTFDQYANVRPARLLPGVTSPLVRGKVLNHAVLTDVGQRGPDLAIPHYTA